MGGPTVIIRLSQFNLTKFDCQLELSLAKSQLSLCYIVTVIKVDVFIQDESFSFAERYGGYEVLEI